MPVGDITSNERGTGARFNDGKVRVDYLKFKDVAIMLGVMHDLKGDSGAAPILVSMQLLGAFQEDGQAGHLVRLVETLYSSNSVLAIREACDVFDYGSKKYATWNWAKGMPWSVPVACIGRHLLKIFEGEEIDAESGFPHAGHVACNVFMLMEYYRNYPEGNDLPMMFVKAKS